MQTPLVHSTNQTFLQNANGNAIHEGERVFVRVADLLPNKTYLVSAFGNLIKTTSTFPLAKGDTFFAQVFFQNGNVVLKTENGKTLALTENAVEKFSHFFNADGTIANENLSQFFLSLGLPNNFFSLALLSAFKNLSMKFDAKLFQKIKLLSMQFSDDETDEHEVQDFATALFHKTGILSTSAIKQLLDFSKRGERNSNETFNDFSNEENANEQNTSEENANEQNSENKKNEGNKNEQNSKAQNENFFEIKNEIKNFFFSLFHENEHSRKETLVSLFNSVGFSKEKNFIFFPFIFETENEKNARGKFSFFFNSQKKSLEKLLVSATTKKNKFAFALFFEKPMRILCAFENENEKLFRDFQNFVKTNFSEKKLIIETTDFQMLRSVSDVANEFEFVRGKA